VSDGQGNDLPRAYIVPQSPASMKLTGIDITEFLNARVSSYKRLRGGVAFVDEIPRNVNGKIMRNILKEWADKDKITLRSNL
jgi:acyl-coenzyme A synthetase/AMP-(fatty) acid ligase